MTDIRAVVVTLTPIKATIKKNNKKKAEASVKTDIVVVEAGDLDGGEF